MRLSVTSMRSKASANGQNANIIAPNPITDMYTLLSRNIPARVTRVKKTKISAVTILLFAPARTANSVCSPSKRSAGSFLCAVMILLLMLRTDLSMILYRISAICPAKLFLNMKRAGGTQGPDRFL